MDIGRKWPGKMWVAISWWIKPYAQSFVVRMRMKEVIVDRLASVLGWGWPRGISVLALPLSLIGIGGSQRGLLQTLYAALRFRETER